MKKQLGTILAAGVLLTGVLSHPAEAATTKPIKVYIDEKLVKLDQQPIVKNNRVLVPFRQLSEGVGAKVTWNPKTQTVTVTHSNKKIILTNSKTTGTVNGKQVKMEVTAQTVNGRILVPLRFLTESLGAEVQYNGTAKEVHVSTYKTTSDKYYYSDSEGNLGTPITEQQFVQKLDTLVSNREVVNSMQFKNLIDGSTGLLTERYGLIEQSGKLYSTYSYLEGTLVNGKATKVYLELEVRDAKTGDLIISDQGETETLPFNKAIQYTAKQAITDLGNTLP